VAENVVAPDLSQWRVGRQSVPVRLRLRPVIAIAIELVVLLFVVLGAAAARVVLRRPWTVQAVSGQARRHVWRVVGWRASGALAGEVAAALRDGRELPAGEVQALPAPSVSL
jgi:hypothetical protein